MAELRRWAVMVAALPFFLLFALLAPPASATTVPLPPSNGVTSGQGATFAALGDSYSAGDGVGPFVPWTVQPGVNTCHRSLLGYGVLLDKALALGPMADVACSGAVTADLFLPNHNGNKTPAGYTEPAQLCQLTALTVDGVTVSPCAPGTTPALGRDTKTVTLTIGGNDVGFTTVLSECLYLAAGSLKFGFPGTGCSSDPAVSVPAAAALLGLAGAAPAGVESSDGTQIYPISTVLDAIHAAAPNAHVYIAGYPMLFQDTRDSPCLVGKLSTSLGTLPVFIGPRDAAWFDAGTKVLDGVIRAAAAKDAGWATFVDVTGQFTGHGVCGPDFWINPVTGSAQLTMPFAVHPNDTSMHPNLWGNAFGYERAIALAMAQNAS